VTWAAEVFLVTGRQSGSEFSTQDRSPYGLNIKQKQMRLWAK
jgi:hypothetical protein